MTRSAQHRSPRARPLEHVSQWPDARGIPSTPPRRAESSARVRARPDGTTGAACLPARSGGAIHVHRHPTALRGARVHAARDQPREELSESQYECLSRAYLDALRRDSGAQYLLERSPPSPQRARALLGARMRRGVAVGAVRFLGNQAISSAELADVVVRAARGPWAPLEPDGTLDRDVMDLLHAAYSDHGFLNVALENPPEELTTCRPSIDHAIVTVREGARTRIRHLDVQEFDERGRAVAPLGGRAAMLELLGVRAGEWFARGAMARGIMAVQTRYRDEHPHGPVRRLARRRGYRHRPRV